MGYEPKLDVTQQTQLPQLSAVASNKIREIAEICNAHLKADKVSEYTHTSDTTVELRAFKLLWVGTIIIQQSI